MTSAGGQPGPLAPRLATLIAVPLLVALLLPPLLSWRDRRSEPDPGTRFAALEVVVREFLAQGASLAENYLRHGDEPAQGSPAQGGVAAGRLEGVARYRSDGALMDWFGTPAEAPLLGGRSDFPLWSVRVDGVRTRLLVRAGPAPDGRLALATFVVDSTLDDLALTSWLPAGLLRGVHLHWVESTASREPPDAPAPSMNRLLRAPDGTALAEVELSPLFHPPLQERTATARALAALLFVLLAAFLFPWRRIATLLHGPWIVGAVLILSRALVAWAEVPARLLSREFGSPSVYGLPGWGGTLASPADLLLTGVTVAALARLLRGRLHSMAPARPRLAAGLTAVTALGLLGVGAVWTHSLAKDASLPLLDRPGPIGANAELVLWLGLLCVLLAAAELSVAIWRSAPRWASAAAYLLLISASGLYLQFAGERLALEQLSTFYAPAVREQSTRREVALRAALREIAERLQDDAVVFDELRRAPEYLAYDLWAGTELFHSGYKSAIDVYDSSGEMISHFSFDLPPLAEPRPLGDAVEIRLRREQFHPMPAVRQTLVHATLDVQRDGFRVATLVGHVLDEPENLPFLPWSQPYLAALGPNSPRRTGEEFGGGPQYVLYDSEGRTLISTLRQSPAASPAWRAADAGERVVRVQAGEDAFIGLALSGTNGQLHLLLLPLRDALALLAAVVRLALVGLALLASIRMAPRLVRAGSLRELRRTLTGSFQHKLLVTLLVGSVLPLLGLSLVLQGSIARRGDAALTAFGTQLATAAQRVVEDYLAAGTHDADNSLELGDALLYWLRGVVGQEIHVYRDGLLLASSKRELFAAGLLPPRLDGEVYRRLTQDRMPAFVKRQGLGPTSMPVAFAPIQLGALAESDLIVAVPLVLEGREIDRAIARIVATVLLTTVLLIGLQIAAASRLARTVSRPVHELVRASASISAGDYAARLTPRTHDELADLVRAFNTMAAALTEQRADLERRRDYIETLLRHATTGVLSLDASLRVVTCNPAAHALWAVAGIRVVEGQPLVDALQTQPAWRPLVQALAAPAQDAEPFEIDLAGPQGTRRLRLVRVQLPTSQGERRGELILLDDVTDLMRSNQLAAWAEMARAIAHEIKNPLTPIQLSTEHLERVLRDRGILPAKELEDCLSTILRQVRTLHEIAGEFSAYAKLPALERKPCDPGELMREVIAPYRAGRPPGLVIDESYTPTAQVPADRRVLGRALINLIENALHAMNGAGTLTLTVRADDLPGHVRMTIRDSGPGIADEVRSRLFEPYFSTKSAGTGLGLAIVQRAVQAHHGSIHVETRPGRGTAFHVVLPADPT